MAAFTIPEVLAVIAIIVIVIALLLPSLNSAREPVYAAICSSNLHQLMISSRAYAVDNSNYLPFPNWGGYGRDNNSETRWTIGGWLYWRQPNTPRWDTNEHWTSEIVKTGLIFEYHTDLEVYRCPRQKKPYPLLSGQVTSYNMNGSVCNYGQDLTNRTSQFRSGDFIFWEPDPYILKTGQWWDGANQPNEGISTLWHVNGGTLVAIDGHTEWMSKKEYNEEKAQPGRNKLWNAPN